MSTDDPPKDKTEERADRELQLKIDTLKLEQEKFSFTKLQAGLDRMGAAAVRGAAALLFAHGSVLVICLTSYKSVAETLTMPVFLKNIQLLGVGFICAMMAFSGGLTLSATSPTRKKWSNRGSMATLIYFGLAALASFGLLCWILASSLKALKGS